MAITTVPKLFNGLPSGLSQAEYRLYSVTLGLLQDWTAVSLTAFGTGAYQAQIPLPFGFVQGYIVSRAPGDSTTVAFAVLVAPTLAQLQASADAAAQLYATMLPTRVTAVLAGFSVYPNPTTGLLRVEVPADFGLRKIQLHNALGQLVRQQAASGTATVINLAGLAPGLYLLRVQGASSVVSETVEVR